MYKRQEKNVARVALSGLSVEGKILFPVYQKMPVMSEIKASQERKKMLCHILQIEDQRRSQIDIITKS